jgi:hypothetical protein
VTPAEFRALGNRSYLHPVVVKGGDSSFSNAQLSGVVSTCSNEVGVLRNGDKFTSWMLPMEDVELVRCRSSTLDCEVDV